MNSAHPNSALVVAAHPDDEVLGCGGTIARLADEGWNVHVLIVAEGITSRSPVRNASEDRSDLDDLARCAKRAAEILGVRTVELEAFPDNRLDTVPLLDIVKRIEQAVQQYAPTRVFTHHMGDVNIDHTRLHNAVCAACRPLPGSSVREVYYFEVVSSTEWRGAHSMPPFVPNVFVDISRTLQRKLEALGAYQTEMRAFPHARSIEAVEHLARWRGASVGCAAAEAFALGRSIV